MLDNHHHGSPHFAVWLPQTPEGQLTLLEADPARFFRPPYVGPKGWVGVVLDTRPDWAEVALLVRESYRLVATAKLRKALDAANGPEF
jgi:predicted DNA-binding protein (MmcQ/YjbR family)